MKNYGGPSTGLFELNPSDGIVSNVQNVILRYRLFRLNNVEDQKLWSSSHFLIKKDEFALIGGFNETLDYYEDMDFFARCLQTGLPVKVDPDFTAIHLKQFSFASVLGDYFRKSLVAIRARTRDPGVYKGIKAGISPLLHLTAIGFIVPLLFLIASGFMGDIPGNEENQLTHGSFLSLAISYLAFQFAVCPKQNPFTALSGLVIWSSSYLVIWITVLRFGVEFVCEKTINLLREGIDWLILSFRVITKLGRPVQLIMYITSRCNLRCEHCFYKETLDDPNPGEIPLPVITKTLKQIGPLLWYSLAGGEPFVRRDLPEIIEMAHKTCRPKVFSFPTNGWFTEKTFTMVLQVLQRVNRGNLILFFSLDGPKDIHDEIRGKGSYDRLMETIQRLRALKKIYGNLYLNIVTTITPRNAPCAEQFIKDTVQTLKPDAISINLFRYHQPDAPKLPTDLLDAYRLAVETYSDQIQSGQLSHYRFLGRSILKAKEIVQKELIYRVAKYNEFITQCTAGTLSYVVMEDGAIKPCEILDDKIGNVYDDDGSFTKHITSKETRKLRNWIRDTKCRCTYECAMSTNTLFSMPMPLKLMKQMIKPRKKPQL